MTMADQQTRKTGESTQTSETRELVATGQRRYVPNYAPKEMILDRGEGARMWDLDGNEYVDFGAGISVTSLGHGDPELAEALTAQAAAGAVELRWKAVAGAVRYGLLVWWDGLADWQPLGGDNLTGTSYTHTDLAAGTTYYYTISAINADGKKSDWLQEPYPSATVTD